MKLLFKHITYLAKYNTRIFIITFKFRYLKVFIYANFKIVIVLVP